MQIKYHRVVVAGIVLAPKLISQQLSDNPLNPAGVKCNVIHPWINVEKLKESTCLLQA